MSERRQRRILVTLEVFSAMLRGHQYALTTDFPRDARVVYCGMHNESMAYLVCEHPSWPIVLERDEPPVWIPRYTITIAP